MSKTSDEAVVLSLYSVSGFFVEQTQCLGQLEVGGVAIADEWDMEKT